MTQYAPVLQTLIIPLLNWYQNNKRELAWRKEANAYHTWVSEIMLQQTRVEAVKPYYTRFIQALPTISSLANASEDTILKLWEGLGYYSRIRNMQKAAQRIMTQYNGVFPSTFPEILSLPGVGSYTAGAIASIAFSLPTPAVDGNVLRVLARILNDDADILKASTKKKMEILLTPIIPAHAPGDFNQSLIELGALICLPTQPKCTICPISSQCIAKSENKTDILPIRKKKKERKIEMRTVLLIRSTDQVAIRKRPDIGLLASLYEFPNIEGHMEEEEVLSYIGKLGLSPLHIRSLGNSKHIFTHIEWHMIGFEIYVGDITFHPIPLDIPFLFISKTDIDKNHPIPSAFRYYREYLVDMI